MPIPDRDADGQFGTDVVETLRALEQAMWNESTRGDRAWMDSHLADDFIEFGYSGRAYTRTEILDQVVGSIEVVLDDLIVRPLGRDAALVTYRSDEPRRSGHRASVWRRVDDRWLLAFHQGTPTV